MKVKDIIYHYTIRLDFIKNKVEQTQKSYQVIGYNDTNLAINDSRFTTIRHTKMYRGDREKLFNEVTIVDTSSWNIPNHDYIQATLFTQSSSIKVATKRMKKELEQFIYKKHGRYCNAITILEQIEV